MAHCARPIDNFEGTTLRVNTAEAPEMVLQVGLAKVLSRENMQMSMESTFDWAAPEVTLFSVPGL